MPLNYNPPNGAEELIERYAAGERAFGDLDLRGIDLRGACLKNVDLTGTGLSGANLAGADLTWADFTRADLRGADLTKANLSFVDFNFTNLQDARLIGARLFGAFLSGVHLTRTDFHECLLDFTSFVGVDLRLAVGLDSINSVGPSTVGTDTLAASLGQIPEVFLRGCGLSDWEIKAARLYDPDLPRDLATNLLYEIENLRFDSAFQLNPLFISYSHRDSAFVDTVERLLDKAGVRYWRDVAHATAGRLEKQIDRAIRHNPTVLLVLSENSVQSDWVEWEASKARGLEKELKRDVLCPVALDDSWKTCEWPGWLRQQIMDHNILDFSKWKDAAMMGSQFRKLLDGLALYYKPGKKN